eukprot:7443558-Pyramimonas_sp.AAC.1
MPTPGKMNMLLHEGRGHIPGRGQLGAHAHPGEDEHVVALAGVDGAALVGLVLERGPRREEALALGPRHRLLDGDLGVLGGVGEGEDEGVLAARAQRLNRVLVEALGCTMPPTHNRQSVIPHPINININPASQSHTSCESPASPHIPRVTRQSVTHIPRVTR